MFFLEWGGFMLALLSCLLYGRSVKQGAAVGVISGLTIILWGILKDIPAAVVCNLGFLVINSFNLIKKKVT